MSDFAACPICHGYGFLSTHRCPPRWQCLEQDEWAVLSDEFSWRTIYAQDAESAAANFAHERDSYNVEYHEYHTVLVRKDEVSPIAVYQVTMELIPTYSASHFNVKTYAPDKAHWSIAPAWAMFRAQNELGDWLWHQNKPVASDTGEWFGGDKCQETSDDAEPNPDWRETLEERPS